MKPQGAPPVAKRGSTDFCLVVGVNKPLGLTSHDVVNRVRRIFGERRVGHTGTLDPLATGVLPICIGPATRLGSYLTGHDKHYRVRVAFGMSTTTDDAEGEVLRRGEPDAKLEDPAFAASYVSSLVGPHKQLPPAYSAVKVQGKKSYEAARQGTIIDLTPRDIEVLSAELAGMGTGYACPGASPQDSTEQASGDVELPWWDIDFHVSKGTYIRSLARDMGNALGCPAHVAALLRTQSGLLRLEDCVTLETLAELKERAALDPVQLLGFRFAFADGALRDRVANGGSLPEGEVQLFVRRNAGAAAELCACTAGVAESQRPAQAGEVASIVVDNRLAALYEYAPERGSWVARCVFQKGVLRGSYI